MQRPQSHQTDSEGEALLRAVFEPLTWAVVSIRPDYGFDFDIQIFESGIATGEWFKVQLKSSRRTKYSASGDYVSEALDIDHARHYSTEIRDPIFLIHADVESKRLFWYAPQLNAPVSPAGVQRSIAIPIQVKNELPRTIPEMLAALRRIRIQIGARTLSGCDLTDFAKGTRHSDKEHLIEGLQDKADYLRLQKARDLSIEGDFATAKTQTEKILQNPDSSVQMKYSAILEEERTDFLSARASSAPQSTTSEIHLRTGKRLQKLTRHGPAALKLFALIARKAGELDVLTFRSFGLRMNVMTHEMAGGAEVARQLAIENIQITHQIIRKYAQCIKLARIASNSEHRWAVPQALLRIVESVVTFVLRLKTEGQLESADRYRASAFQLCELSVWIADLNHDDDALSRATTTVMVLADKSIPSSVDAAIKFAQSTLTKIKDIEVSAVTRDSLDRATRRMAGEAVEGEPEPDLAKQIIENKAWGLGIDMTNKDDLTVKSIRIGINDLNPERGIRHCIHAFVSISGGVPAAASSLAALLDLPSINAKILHCDLHNYSVERRSLDAATSRFKQQYCDVCPDISARDAHWKYTDEWQKDENAKHLEFMEAFYRARYGR
jgi:Domain of unknown function (DUF4365)